MDMQKCFQIWIRSLKINIRSPLVLTAYVLLHDRCMDFWYCSKVFYLGKVSPTFPAALFTVDARFARKIERLQTGIK